MSTERGILAASVGSRKAYSRIAKHITADSLTASAKVVMGKIAEYYERDPSADSCDMGLLTEQVLHSVANPKHKETFIRIMEGVGEADVSAINVAVTILEARREALGSRIGVAMASGETDVADLMEEYLALNVDLYVQDQDEEKVINNLDLDALMDVRGGGDLIKVFPSSLNNRLGGGMLRGEHMVFFARPEMGKTMFLVNAIGGFLAQGLRVLYIANEEPVVNTAMRIINRITGRTYAEVEADRAGAMEIARERGWSNLFMKHLTPGTPREIEELVVETRADVFIVDQLRNVDVREENLTRGLEKASKIMRQIGARTNSLAISATQAGDSASGKAVLEMNDVDSSNTGIPASCDVQVGMGGTNEDIAANRRVMALIKNKRTGNHEFFPVSVEPQLSKIGAMG